MKHWQKWICLKENETDCLERGNLLVEHYENYSQKTMAVNMEKPQHFGWLIYINTYRVLHPVSWKLMILLYLVILFFNYPQFILAPIIITMLDGWFFMP